LATQIPTTSAHFSFPLFIFRNINFLYLKTYSKNDATIKEKIKLNLYKYPQSIAQSRASLILA